MRSLLSLAAFALLFAACDATAPAESGGSGDGLDDVTVPAGFDYATTRSVEVTLSAASNTGAPLAGVPMDLRTPDGRRLATATTGTDGRAVLPLAVPLALDSLVVAPRYLGLGGEARLAITGSRLSAAFGGPAPSLRTGAPAGTASAAKSGFATLGEWTRSGVPLYLEGTDSIDAGLLATLNASLPENSRVPEDHPEYLAEGNETDAILTEEADVWVTFVHEGAGWRNALGFYTYDPAAPPASPAEIDTKTLVFPNVSFAGSGGGLHSGDRVHIGRFPAGTAIGWFLVSNGWNGSGVGSGYYTVYSNPDFNPETSPARRQHNVLLRDAERELLLLAFEDVSRDNVPFGSDEDFNDAVFYVTSNPVTAIETGGVPEVTDPGRDPEADADRDGVLNGLDDAPYDPDVASTVHLPAEGEAGTLAYEDLWPGRGDYDFNDLVADYALAVGVNADGRATRMDAEITVQAIGAGYRNALALALPVPAAAIRSASGASLTRSVFSLASTGTEIGQPSAVLPLFDDAYALVERPSGYFVNTEREAPAVAPGSVTVSIEFSYPIPLGDLRLDRLDLFLVSDGERGREVHLPGFQPTALADPTLLGSSSDRTQIGTDVTYVNEQGLPWAIHVPEAFVYPVEREAVDAGHLRFVGWARSGGADWTDWYADRPGYRDASRLYAR
ncbi:MAG TPA: LruC domain-containing protein [Bacteroidetes bacterium]|nr:LruC domain-containing protein [Bacteroidota bacterium]